MQQECLFFTGKMIVECLNTFCPILTFMVHIHEGAYPNIKELAKAIGIDSGVVAKAIRLTWLSPKITHKIIIWEVDISMQTLRRSFPIVWSTQEKELL